MSWYNASWKNLEPETVAAIKSMEMETKRSTDYYVCGCEESHQDGESWLHICNYHDGFDEGVAATRSVSKN